MFYLHRWVRPTFLIITIMTILLALASSTSFAAPTIKTKPPTKKVKLHHPTKTRKTNKKVKTIKHPHHHVIPAPLKPVTAVSKVNTANISHSYLPTYLLTSMEKNLVRFVKNTIESIRYTNYKLGGTKIDDNKGIYIVDCSSYVDHILKTIYPNAYSSLTKWSGSQKPTTNDYYHYFRNLSDDSEHWNSINDVDELRPGDILVFRNKNRFGTETGGHVMVVMDKPERNGNTFILRIADAAPAGHSKDTRMPHASGIGIGSMLLKVNPTTSLPYAYAWKVGSRWESNVNFAMARPVGTWS